MESNPSSFAKDSLSVFGTRILLILISIVSSIIVTRILGPANRGVMEILVLVPYMLVNFGNLGVGNANLYFIGKKAHPIEKIVSNSLALSLVLGAGLILIAYGSFNFYHERLFKDIPFYYTFLAFWIIPFLMFQKFIQYTLLGKEEIASRNMIVLFPAVINFLVTICVVVIIKLSLLGVLIASFASNLSAALLCFYYISKQTEVKFWFDYKLFIRSVKFGMIPFLALLVINLNLKANVFLIKYYMNDTAVGLYTLAVTVVDKITLLPEAIGLVLFSKVSNITEGEAVKITPLVCRFSMLSSLVIGAVLFISADFLIPLVYGKEFQLSVRPLLILIPGIISMTLFLILHGDLTGRGRAKITLYVFTLAFLVNIILNLFLIPLYGIDGAALASTVSYCLGAVGLVSVFAKINSISMLKLLFPTKEDFVRHIIPFISIIKRGDTLL